MQPFNHCDRKILVQSSREVANDRAYIWEHLREGVKTVGVAPEIMPH